jgi:hypothetical protein
MNWYYALGDQRQGPVSESELDALIASGKINENTLMWKEGMANWAPLREVRAAGAQSGEAPPGWIRCTATGRYFPPEEIVYLDGKPYSAAAKPGVLQNVLQTGALPTTEVGRTGPAWENRQQLGFFPAIVQTVRSILLDPAVAFSTMKREGGFGNPLGFDVLLSWAGFIAAAIYNVGLQGLTGSLAPRSQAPFNPMAMSAVVMGVLVVLMPLLTVISAFIGSGVLHLSLMLCQGAKQPFETTFRTHCYVMGAVAPLQFIPVCGAYAAIVWAAVALCIGMAKAHEINTGRAVLAVLLPMAVCCLASGFLIASSIGIAAAAAQGGHH